MSPFNKSSSGRLVKRLASAALNKSSLGESRKRAASLPALNRFRSANALLETRKINIRWTKKAIVDREGQLECAKRIINIGGYIEKITTDFFYPFFLNYAAFVFM